MTGMKEAKGLSSNTEYLKFVTNKFVINKPAD